MSQTGYLIQAIPSVKQVLHDLDREIYKIRSKKVKHVQSSLDELTQYRGVITQQQKIIAEFEMAASVPSAPERSKPTPNKVQRWSDVVEPEYQPMYEEECDIQEVVDEPTNSCTALVSYPGGNWGGTNVAAGAGRPNENALMLCDWRQTTTDLVIVDRPAKKRRRG